MTRDVYLLASKKAKNPNPLVMNAQRKVGHISPASLTSGCPIRETKLEREISKLSRSGSRGGMSETPAAGDSSKGKKFFIDSLEGLNICLEFCTKFCINCYKSVVLKKTC